MASKIVKTSTGDHGTTAVVTPDQKVRVWMQVIISLVLLLAGLIVLSAPNYILRHNTDESLQKLAAGWIGALIGYWLP